MSALLEQHSHNKLQPLSRKVNVITDFLESVVQVVPLESIAYVMSYCSYDKAVKCARATTETFYHLPPSLLMKDGLQQSMRHLDSGISPDVVQTLDRKAFSKFDKQHKSHHIEHYTKLDVDQQHLTIRVSDENQSAESMTQFAWNDLKQQYNVENTEDIASEVLRNTLRGMYVNIFSHSRTKSTKVVCGLSIEYLYPIISADADTEDCGLQSPIDVLLSGKQKLASLSEKNSSKPLVRELSSKQKSLTSLINSQMLQTVNDIRQNDLSLCTALLGAFMEQQEIDIPLMRSHRDRSKAIQLSGKASVGVWALSNLKLSDLQQILKQCHDDQLFVKIESYIKTIISSRSMSATPEDDQYAAKLHFIVQGMKRSVTCNTQHISYSLECQLADLCTERNITESFPLEQLCEQWDTLFEGNVLSLVALSHRPLLSRWLKWALMVHKLREKLAEYTAIGVVGLVNSGKSRLVSNLFGIQVNLNVERRNLRH